MPFCLLSLLLFIIIIIDIIISTIIIIIINKNKYDINPNQIVKRQLHFIRLNHVLFWLILLLLFIIIIIIIILFFIYLWSKFMSMIKLIAKATVYNGVYLHITINKVSKATIWINKNT